MRLIVLKIDIESKMKYKKDTKRLAQYKEIKVEFQNGSYGYNDLIGGPYLQLSFFLKIRHFTTTLGAR